MQNDVFFLFVFCLFEGGGTDIVTVLWLWIRCFCMTKTRCQFYNRQSLFGMPLIWTLLYPRITSLHAVRSRIIGFPGQIRTFISQIYVFPYCISGNSDRTPPLCFIPPPSWQPWAFTYNYTSYLVIQFGHLWLFWRLSEFECSI